MYYHKRPLEYVTYGPVGPPPVEVLDPFFELAYRWLGRHCGYFPQVWLSRSRSGITGYNFRHVRNRERTSDVMFGFECIRGFPVDYALWCQLINSVSGASSLEDADRRILAGLVDDANDPGLQDEPLCRTVRATRDLATVLARHLFVERDQVVVPRLNLKAAKRIVCRDERQKRILRKMGFIEDRIEIRGRHGSRPRDRDTAHGQ